MCPLFNSVSGCLRNVKLFNSNLPRNAPLMLSGRCGFNISQRPTGATQLLISSLRTGWVQTWFTAPATPPPRPSEGTCRKLHLNDISRALLLSWGDDHKHLCVGCSPKTSRNITPPASPRFSLLSDDKSAASFSTGAPSPLSNSQHTPSEKQNPS